MNLVGKIENRVRVNQQLRRNAEAGNKSSDKVWLYNFWKVKAEEMWLTRFLAYRGLLNRGKRVSFYSVFGNRRIVRYDRREVKIFISGENVHMPCFEAYSDNMLSNGRINLAMGFDYIEDERYIRFPLWLRTSFLPEWSEKEIIDHVQKLRYPEIGKRNQFAALVARYDWGKTRSQIFEALKIIDRIQCPSQVLHNDDSLMTVYQDDKKAYLRQFHFNICPENSNYKGYVTEKLFDSISAGCIPIYWGSDNCPEPEVLNQEAMVLWNVGGDNSRNISWILHLWENRSKLIEVMHLPRLKDGAEEIIIEFFSKLDESMKELL